ncbi:hypothetical protein VNO80_20517 [Phaseolus coccineus]|uniref:Uncharacterized protein n=1 Tax=Phaseolus coccineus TaxID=3886 RepID=A0AAN9M1H7_PHACN
MKDPTLIFIHNYGMHWVFGEMRLTSSVHSSLSSFPSPPAAPVNTAARCGLPRETPVPRNAAPHHHAPAPRHHRTSRPRPCTAALHLPRYSVARRTSSHCLRAPPSPPTHASDAISTIRCRLSTLVVAL